jgi:nitroreductase
MEPGAMSVDEALATTRTVRKRLDLTRPVERGVLEECLALAQQAPTGGNRQGWGFVVVTDPAKRLALAEVYRKGWRAYRASPLGDVSRAPATQQETLGRVLDSADYLAEHLHEVPVHLIPCIRGRMEKQPVAVQAGVWGSILPAVWSFMLAARARGLGTAWTTVHLSHEQEAAEILGIPYDKVMQAALVPVAYTIGTEFKAGARMALDEVVHWEGW